MMKETPVDSHHNAALTPRGRARMVRAVIDQGLSYRKAVELFHVVIFPAGSGHLSKLVDWR